MLEETVQIVRWEGLEARECTDCVAREEPLEIVLEGESLAVTMRTPGDDFALAAGFLYAEGIVASRREIGTMGYLGRPGDPAWQNLLHVALRAAGPERSAPRPQLQRNFLATSACGVCGKASLEAARCTAAPLPDMEFRVPVATFSRLNAQMRAAQKGFERTGGLHAAGLFDITGTLRALREDVGRHNAVDKLIGAEFMAGRTPLSERLLFVSGRASFEILQKAAVARIPIVCAVSAPSSLAVQLARDLNITLIGFLRGDTMNVYSGSERLVPVL
jgi:FdhD protein